MLNPIKTAGIPCSAKKPARHIDWYWALASVLLVAAFTVMLAIGTELRVNGIPCISLWQVQKMANINHGETLDDFVEFAADDATETFWVGMRDGVKLFEYTDYEEDRVALPTETSGYFARHYSDLVWAHNHPETDIGFSSQDLESFGSCKYATESVVVTPNLVFHLEKAEGCVVPGEELEEFLSCLDDYAYAMSYETRVFYLDVNGEECDSWTAIEEAFAERFDMRFWVEARGEAEILAYENKNSSVFDPPKKPTNDAFGQSVHANDHVQHMLKNEFDGLKNAEPYVIPNLAGK